MNFPFEWQPTIVSHQLAVIGDLALACVPGEFTTMAGRRLRHTVHQALQQHEVPPRGPEDVIVVGLCNTYSDYITTPEEYEVRGLCSDPGSSLQYQGPMSGRLFTPSTPLAAAGPALRGSLYHLRATHPDRAPQDVP